VGISMAAGLVLLGRQVGAAEDDSQGAQLAATCASCHSLNGSDEGIPIIAGLDEQRIIDAVLAYRASETPSHVMHAVALSLSDEEIAGVARYLATHGEAP
jgi:sulfide dehydrogenase cytochrome subunit